MSNGECYDCKYTDEFDWFWLIPNSQDASVNYATYVMMREDENNLGHTYIIINSRPNCKAEQ